jgi:hypothetical protein
MALGLRRIILEGGALEVVRAVRKEEKELGKYGQIIKDVKLLLQNVQEYDVLHVKHRQMGQLIVLPN